MKWTGTQDIYLPDNGSVADVYTIGAGLDMDIPVMPGRQYAARFGAQYDYAAFITPCAPLLSSLSGPDLWS